MIPKIKATLRTIRQKYSLYMDSITTKIVVIMTVIIIPLNILVISATMSSVTDMQEQTRTSMENLSNLYMQQLENRVLATNYYLYSLMNQDTDFIRLSEQNGDSDYYRSQTIAAQKLRTNIQTTENANGYFYYSKKLDQFVLMLPDKPDMEDDRSVMEIRDALQEWIKGPKLEELQNWSICEVKGTNWMLCMLREGDFYYGALISLDEVIYDITSSVEWNGFQVLIKEPVTTKKELCVKGQSKKIVAQWWFLVPKQEVILRLPRLRALSILLALLYLFLIPALFLILKLELLRPLGRIQGALLKLKHGDQDYRISVHKYAREFREINQNFNEMADNVQTLKIENYEKELERREVAIRNLQLQIHPHFLLNTFNLMYSLASMQDYKNIQKMALYLSEYFRYVFRSGKSLELFSQELKLIKSYLEVSRIRFLDSFEVSYQIDEAALSVEVPPLLIHNLVENIMHHGLDMGRIVHIKLIAHFEDGFAEFLVMDDGKGMPEEVVEQINQGVFQSKEGNCVHIGIENSYERIRSIYGAQGSLEVESVPNQGTCFTVRFPYHGKAIEIDW